MEILLHALDDDDDEKTGMEDPALSLLLQKDYLEEIPLHIAASRGSYDMTKLLLSKKKTGEKTPMEGTKDKPTFSTMKNRDGLTPFHQNVLGASRFFGSVHLKIAQLLLDNGADIHDKDNQGFNILHIMAKQPTCYETILLHQQETLGIPFVTAIEETNWSKNGNTGSGNKHVAQLLSVLIDRGANIDQTVYSAAEKTRCYDSVRPGYS